MSMSIDGLKNNLTNPLRTYTWDVTFFSPVGGEGTTLSLRCQSASKPGRSVGSIAVPYKQSAGIQYPGKLAYSHDWTLTFIEGEDKKVYDAIYLWKNAVVTDKGQFSLGDNLIKADLYLTLSSTADEIVEKIRVIGCFPKEIGAVSLDYSTEDIVKYEVTFSFDSWEKLL